MSDPTDRATEREEQERERAIAAARSKSSSPAAPVSDDCANDCGELRVPPSRYCCLECRDAADYRETIRRKQNSR